MCDINKLSDTERQKYVDELREYVNSFCGVNFFLLLIESLRKSESHPLTSGKKVFNSSKSSIKWNKVIFNDKLQLLKKIRLDMNEDGNLVPTKSDKSYKKVMNLLRTLAPLEVEIIPDSEDNSKRILLKAFDIIDEKTTKLNPMFDAIFFCSVDSIKKALKS
ncbi:MAG: hypothetical protein U9N42_01515 [Campylobacterota bacterium]|nr:hypothetical protein [Campylobacterota bacterium]